MSVQTAVRRKTAPDILARKGGEPIVMLTSYHAHTAVLVDRHCDVILVGDSLGNVMNHLQTKNGRTGLRQILNQNVIVSGRFVAGLSDWLPPLTLWAASLCLATAISLG